MRQWSCMLLCAALSSFLCPISASATPGATAPPKKEISRAERLYQEGAELYGLHQYEAAADKLQESFQLQRDVDKLSYLILALSGAGRGEDARRYLDLAKRGGLAPDDLAVLEKKVPAPPPVLPAPPAPPAVLLTPPKPEMSAPRPALAAVSVQQPSPRERPRWLIPVTATLAGSSVALVAAGLLLALPTWCDSPFGLNVPNCPQAFQNLPQAGWALVGAGGATLVGGGITLGVGLSARKEGPARTRQQWYR